jgi:hypothetical protein
MGRLYVNKKPAPGHGQRLGEFNFKEKALCRKATGLFLKL